MKKIEIVLKNLNYISRIHFDSDFDLPIITEDEINTPNTLFEQIERVSSLTGVKEEDITFKKLWETAKEEENSIFPKLYKKFIKLETVSIPFISKARAGELVSTRSRDTFPKLILPKRLLDPFPDADYNAFEIEGDSMEPIATEGTTIIARKSDLWEEWKDGESYIVVHSSGVFFKRVYKSPDFENNCKLILKSENNQLNQHPPFEILYEESITELWKPRRIIGSFKD